MASDAANTLFQPPHPPIPARDLGPWQRLSTYRRNVIESWSRRAYEEEVLTWSTLGRRTILMNRPSGIEQVLGGNVANYSRPAFGIRLLRPTVGRGLLLSEGEEWRMQRRTMAPSFVPRVIPILARHFVTVGMETLTRLEAEAAKPIDLLAVMQSLTLEIAGRSMFSLETRKYGASMRRLLATQGRRLAQPSPSDLLLPIWFPNWRDLQRRRYRAVWTELIDSIIADRMKVPVSDESRDLLDLLRAARDPETGQGFSQAELRDQVSTMIVAGHETTALTLFWSLYLLASVPSVQERLAEEAKGIELANAGQALPRLAFCRAVVSEALRLYPPVHTITRQAISADSHGDIAIPAGTRVVISPWVLHRHRRLWTNPDSFDPDRFLTVANPPRYTYMPFGGGPRICIGAHFAMAEAMLILALMVQRFHITCVASEPVLPVGYATTHPDHPPLFLLEARQR
jgi:unspecific monooxygenase